MKTDDELQTALERIFHARYPSHLRDVQAIVDQSSVRLCGPVPTYYAKQVASQLAQEIPGVKQVTNDIEVL